MSPSPTDDDAVDRLLSREDVEKCDQCEAILDHPGYCEMCFQLVWLEWKASQALDDTDQAGSSE